MAREPILTSDVQRDADDDQELRPRTLDQIIGQRDVFERLHIAVDAASKRQEPLGHVLLDGPPGLGKTTFALCIPKALNVTVQLTSGSGSCRTEGPRALSHQRAGAIGVVY